MERNTFWKKLAEDMNNITALPLVELAGAGRILIENHDGIIEYGKETITIRMRYGALSIRGQDLVMKQITKYQLVITGTIHALMVQRGDFR